MATVQTDLAPNWQGLPRANAPVWLRPVLELIVVIGSLELVLFPLRDRSLRFLIPLPVVLLLLVAFRSARRTGWTVRDGLVDVLSAQRAWVGTLLASVVGAVVFLGMVEWLGLLPNGDSKVFGRGLLHWLGKKFPTVAIQQFGVQLFVLPACLEIFRRRWVAVGAAAAVFAFVHLPNLPLMGLTFVAGAVWCSLFLWHGRIAPLIVSHLALAVLASETAGHSLHHMRVGAGCLELLPYSVPVEGGELTVVPEAVVGHVEASRLRGDVVVCRGWALDRRGSFAVAQLVLVVDERVHRFALAGHRFERDDLWQWYGHRDDEAVGFAVPVPSHLLANAESIQAFAEGSDGVLSRISVTQQLRETIDTLTHN